MSAFLFPLQISGIYVDVAFRAWVVWLSGKPARFSSTTIGIGSIESFVERRVRKRAAERDGLWG
jgi:hypothetical protein